MPFTLWAGKTLNAQGSVGCSVGTWKIRMSRAVQKMEASLVKFQRETKGLPGYLCEEYVVFGQLELESAVNNKRTEPLKPLLGH